MCLEIQAEFYGEEKVGEEQLTEMMDAADNINLIGRKTVNVALKKGVAHKEDVKTIAGIEHLQVYKI